MQDRVKVLEGKGCKEALPSIQVEDGLVRMSSQNALSCEPFLRVKYETQTQAQEERGPHENIQERIVLLALGKVRKGNPWAQEEDKEGREAKAKGRGEDKLVDQGGNQKDEQGCNGLGIGKGTTPMA